MADVKIIDHSDEVRRTLEAAIARALEVAGGQAESHAKRNLTAAGRVDNDRLRGSISHEVNEAEQYVVIGTNVEYGKYVEFGTGIHASDGSGRKTPWVYMDDEGKFHTTRGMKPTHFLRDALQGHEKEYAAIIEQEIKRALR